MFRVWREKRAIRKISAFRNMDGWLTDQEALGLYTLALKLPANATVVEIGSWQGKSTYCLASGLSSGKLIAIDPFNADGGNDTRSQEEYLRKKGNKNLLEIFKDNMSAHGVLDKIIIKQGYSYEFADETGEIDLLFIDGDHSISGCTKDFGLFSPKVKPGGFIVFHDYYSDRPELGPTHVIENLVKTSLSWSFYRQFDSLWSARKNN